MNRRGMQIVALAALGAVALGGAALGAQGQRATASTGNTVPTFTKDVAPILYKNCISCHRPGEMAPMSLQTYEEARPYLRSIQTKVETGLMPPWHAEAPVGSFHNERRLTAAERDTIVRWASNGGPQGDPKDLPALPKLAQGWTLGVPDVVLSMPKEFDVPAQGTIAYQNINVPTNFTEDKWVQTMELRTSAPAVVHHILVFATVPGAAPVGDPFRMVQLPNGGNHGVVMPSPAAPPAGAAAAQRPPQAQQPQQAQANRPQPTLVASLAPGTHTMVFQPGTALLIKANSTLTFQIHYTASGAPMKDKSSLGLTFAKAAPRQEMRSSQFFNPQLILPAGAANQQVDAAIEFTQDSHIVALIPHTHLRGKSWEYHLVTPDGKSQTVLSVPKYNFNWQTYYHFTTPIAAPKGSRLEAVAHYDNSSANKANPDATKEVHWGEQTWEEMQYTGITYTVDAAQPTTGQQQ